MLIVCTTFAWILEIVHVGKLQRSTSATSCVTAAIVEQRNVKSSVCAAFFRKSELVLKRNLFTDNY